MIASARLLISVIRIDLPILDKRKSLVVVSVKNVTESTVTVPLVIHRRLQSTTIFPTGNQDSRYRWFREEILVHFELEFGTNGYDQISE